MLPSDIKEVLKLYQVKRAKVIASISAIRDLQRQRKIRYRTYFQAQEEMEAFVDSYKDKELIYEILQLSPEIDTEGIFYNKKGKLEI